MYVDAPVVKAALTVAMASGLGLWACASGPAPAPAASTDPPMRAFAELPAGGLAGAPTPEMGLIRAIQQVYTAAGYPEAADVVEVTWSDRIIGSKHTPGGIALRRIFTGPDGARRYWQDVAGFLFGGRPLDFSGWSEADVTDGYEVFMTALAAHEVGHEVSMRRGSEGHDGVVLEERRVRACEMPVLVRLAALGRIPERWLDLYPRVLEVFMKAVPESARALIEASEDKEQLFYDGYSWFNHGTIADSSLAALYMALEHSHTHALEPDQSLEALTWIFDPPGIDPKSEVQMAMSDVEGLESEPQEDGRVRLAMPERGLAGWAFYDWDWNGYVVTVEAAVAIPAARRAAVEHLLTAANLDSEGAPLALGPNGVVARAARRGIQPPQGLAAPALDMLADWLDPVRQVASGKLGAAAAVELGHAHAAARRAPRPDGGTP